jgi:DNA-binding NarL/FixJ family response regulator
LRQCAPDSRCFLIAVGDSGGGTLVDLVLEQPGVCVHLATSAFQFLSELEGSEFQAIFIDVLFDGGRMFETLKEARQVRSNTPVVCFRPIWSPLAHSSDRVIENAIRVMYPRTLFWDMSSPKVRSKAYVHELESLICSSK